MQSKSQVRKKENNMLHMISNGKSSLKAKKQNFNELKWEKRNVKFGKGALLFSCVTKKMSLPSTLILICFCAVYIFPCVNVTMYVRITYQQIEMQTNFVKALVGSFCDAPLINTLAQLLAKLPCT